MRLQSYVVVCFVSRIGRLTIISVCKGVEFLIGRLRFETRVNDFCAHRFPSVCLWLGGGGSSRNALRIQCTGSGHIIVVARASRRRTD